jgi:hypothetical protein
MRLLVILFPLAQIACLGCAGGDLPKEVQRRDSAGVQIITTTAPLPESEDMWEVSTGPVLAISTPINDADYVLHWLRGAVRLSDGGIVALSDGSKQLLFFDGLGEFQMAVGGSGSGPGEFISPFQLSKDSSDTLVVWDRGNGRVSWFSPQGSYMRSSVPARDYVLDQIPDGFRIGGITKYVPGGLMLRGVISGPRSPEDMPLGRTWRESVGFLVTPEEGGEGAFLGPIPGRERFFIEPSLGAPAFFGGDAKVAVGVHPIRIYIGDSKVIDIRVHSFGGDLIRIIRDGVQPDPVRSEDIEWERWYLNTSWLPTRGAGRAERLAEAMPIPDRKPAFEDLIVDADGYLWMKEYSAHNPNPVRYRIYSPEGVRAGVARLPGSLKVFDIGRDYILGIGYDLDGVETILMYDLRRADID